MSDAGSPVLQDGRLSSRPRRLQDAVTREIGGEVLLVPIRGRLADLRELFMLNQVGLWVWQHLDGAASVGELAQAMSAEFEVGADEAVSDLSSFLEEIDEAGLLEPIGVEPGC